MVDNDDKYSEEEENLTQVRSIIKQLNEEKPSTEKRREVVVRADGTKVIRVTKKRRVMLTAADYKRRDRRQMLFAALGCFVLMLVATAFFFFRMASMTGGAYVTAAQAELQQRWGAASVQIEGAGIEGSTLKLDSIVAEFPTGGMLQRVELHGIEAKLNMMSFITRVLEGDELQIQQAIVQLHPGAAMKMPTQNGSDMWRFGRVNCHDFSVSFGASADEGPMAISHTQAYMYYPDKVRNANVVIFREGKLAIRGWRTVNISEGKARIDASGIPDFSMSGTTDATSDAVEQRRTSIAFNGKMEDAADFTGPYAVGSINMSLADFTGGRFEEFFTARTAAGLQRKNENPFTIRLTAAGEAAPEFAGELQLKDICVKSFPALMSLTEHIVPDKRRFYNPILLNRGYVRLEQKDGGMSLSMPEGALLERDIINLQGAVSVNAQNELSGNLEYGLPSILTRVEYPDGLPDPIFRMSGEWSWLRTRVKGFANMPGDDMAEIEARAEIARRDRPARIPFDEIDVEKLAGQLGEGETLETQPEEQPETPKPGSIDDRKFFEGQGLDDSNPFEEKTEDPFAPSSPF